MSLGARRRQLFPVGLYAGLLLALIALRRPDLVARVEASCLGALALPLRAYGVVGGRPVVAAVLPELVDVPSHELDRRLAVVARARPTQIPAEFQPLFCNVIEAREPGAAGRPSVLVLDRTWSEIEGCEPLVTYGETLLGFVGRPGGRRQDWRQQQVRVELLHFRRRNRPPRRVPGFVSLADNRRLAFLIEPAAAIDTWALRCSLLDDPYLAASLDQDGLEVRTAPRIDDPFGSLPSFLRIGRLQVFGYTVREQFLPIGLYVAPEIEPGNLISVVLWRRGGVAVDRCAPLELGEVVPVRALRLPAPPPTGERCLVLAADSGATLRPGAALVWGRHLVATLVSAGSGLAVVAPFGEPGQKWRLVALAAKTDRDPTGFSARAVARRELPSGRREVRLRVTSPSGLRLPQRGELFSGAVGRDCPSRLWIGPFRVDLNGDLLVEHGGVPNHAALGVFQHRGPP